MEKEGALGLPKPGIASNSKSSRALRNVCRSVLGLIRVYNLLPVQIVEASATVKDFQSALQELVLLRALRGESDWARTLSPRLPTTGRPLVSLLM